MFMKVEYTHRVMQKNIGIEYEGFFAHRMAGLRQVVQSSTIESVTFKWRFDDTI